MRPDNPGEWYSRDGRRILVQGAGELESELKLLLVQGAAELGSEVKLSWRSTTSYAVQWRALAELRDDDWLPAVAPTFPELPQRPKVFAVYATHKDYPQAEWYWIVEGLTHFMTTGIRSAFTHNLTVVPHPDNDPEAVKLIEDAKKAVELIKKANCGQTEH